MVSPEVDKERCLRFSTISEHLFSCDWACSCNPERLCSPSPHVTLHEGHEFHPLHWQSTFASPSHARLEPQFCTSSATPVQNFPWPESCNAWLARDIIAAHPRTLDHSSPAAPPATAVILCRPAVSPGHRFLPDQCRFPVTGPLAQFPGQCLLLAQ